MRIIVAVVIVAVAMLVAPVLRTPPVLAPSASAAEVKYSGPKLCLACHKGTHADVIEAVTGSVHQRAMWKVEDEDENHPLVGDFSGDPPFPKESIAYVLGVGREYQAYLDADLRVLPSKWVVAEKAWRAVEPVDGAHDCVGCHTTGFDPETKKWAALGVTCEMCHGPGSAHAAAKDKMGSIVRPQTLAPDRRVMICGRCHSSGKSKDGAFTYAVGYRPGDDLNEFFTLNAEVPEGAVNSQYNELVGGKHLAAGTICTTCHGGHGPVNGLASQLTAPINDLCLNADCHGGSLTGPQHQPEALKAVTCATCHMPGQSHAFIALKP
jgi:hypothetical protein